MPKADSQAPFAVRARQGQVRIVCARSNVSFCFQLDDVHALIRALSPLRRKSGSRKGGPPDGNLNAARGLSFLVFDAYRRLVTCGFISTSDACQEMMISRATYNRRCSYKIPKAPKSPIPPNPADLAIRRRFLFDRYRRAMSIYHRAAQPIRQTTL